MLYAACIKSLSGQLSNTVLAAELACQDLGSPQRATRAQDQSTPSAALAGQLAGDVIGHCLHSRFARPASFVGKDAGYSMHHRLLRC